MSIETQISELINALTANTVSLKANTAAMQAQPVTEAPASTPEPVAPVTPVVQPAPEVAPETPAPEVAPETPAPEAAPGVPSEGDVLTALRAAMAAIQAKHPGNSVADTKAAVMATLMGAANGARKPADVAEADRATTIAALAALGA